MISILIVIIQFFCLLIGLFGSIAFHKSPFRKKFLIILNLMILSFNTFNIILFGWNNFQYYEFNLNLNIGTLFLWEIIFFLGCIIFFLSKDEMSGILNENLYDTLLIVVIFSLVGASLTLNILITTIFIMILFLTLILIFYFGRYSKPLKLLKYFIISVIISLSFLIIAILIIFFEVNSFILTEINIFEFNPVLNVITSLFFLFGFGLPCGIFPFVIYHLKAYFHDSTYTTLFSLTNLTFPVISFILIRQLIAFSYDLFINSFIILIISIIGLIISITFLLTEIFTSIDGKSYSIKKIIGYSATADFNMILLISAFIGFLPTNSMKIEYRNFLFLFIFSMILVKTLLFHSLKPIILETLDDNIKLLGGFWKNHKHFGIFYLMGGIFLTIPFALGNILLNLITNLFTESIIDLPFISFVGFTIWILLIIYFIIIVIWVSITFNDIFFGNPKHIKFKKIRPITILDYIPQIFILVFSIFLCVLYFINNLLFLEALNSFTENFVY